MASDKAPIEVIEISDGEDPPSRGVARPNGHFPAQRRAGGAPELDRGSIKARISQQGSGTFVTKREPNATPRDKHSDVKHPITGSSQRGITFNALYNRQLNGGSGASKLFKAAFTSGTPEIISLDDSDEEPSQSKTMTKSFVRPRGLTPGRALPTFSNANGNVESRDASDAFREKRQLGDSQSNDDPRPPKKQRISEAVNGNEALVNSSSVLQGQDKSAFTSPAQQRTSPQRLNVAFNKARSISPPPPRRRNVVANSTAKKTAAASPAKLKLSKRMPTAEEIKAAHENLDEIDRKLWRFRKDPEDRQQSSQRNSPLGTAPRATQKQDRTGNDDSLEHNATSKDRKATDPPKTTSGVLTTLPVRQDSKRNSRSSTPKARPISPLAMPGETAKHVPKSLHPELAALHQEVDRVRGQRQATADAGNSALKTADSRDGHIASNVAGDASVTRKKPDERTTPLDEFDECLLRIQKTQEDQRATLRVATPDGPHAPVGPLQSTQSPDKSLRTTPIDKRRPSPNVRGLAEPIVTETEAADLQLRSEALQSDAREHTGMPSPASRILPPPPVSFDKADSLYSHLSLANRVEKILGRYLDELRVDNEYWTKESLKRARLTKAVPTNVENTISRSEEQPASFKHLKPIKFALIQKGALAADTDGVWGVQRVQDGKMQPITEVSAPYTTFSTEEQELPDFSHYVSLRNNLLAPNAVHLHCWPYFGDGVQCDAQTLASAYHVDTDHRDRKILQLIQAQKYRPYVQHALEDLECSWSDVLRYLLEQDPDVGSDLDARKAHQNRSLFCREDFSRSSDRWTAVLDALPASTPETLGRVATLCENFQKMAKFSLWHIARMTPFANLPDDEGRSSKMQQSQLTCRICMRFDCPYHGQYKQHPDQNVDDSDDESVSSVDSIDARDLVHPLKVNYRSRVGFPEEQAPSAEGGEVVDPNLRKKQRDPNYWSAYRSKAEDRGPFYPCSHPGLSCSDAQCSCFAKSIACEKSCGCASDCPRKFKGCSCAHRKGGTVCFENAECVCYQTGRECDPDLCGSCGVCDVIDPVNKHDDRILLGRCRNASIQRRVQKHLLLGDSGVHGLGLYACEDIKANEFVGEYKGEIITKKEADRRGTVYEFQRLSYLFSLNKSQEIDSTYFGNKIRFINHAQDSKSNLYPRIIMVNTVHRIALYASRDIPAGKELLFDYGPKFPNEQLQGTQSKKTAPTEAKKSAPHVRNANLVREFFDVSESEDEDGVFRAKAVSRANGNKGQTKGKKAKGRPRANTVNKPPPLKDEDEMEVSETPPAKRKSAVGNGKKAQQDAGQRLAAFNISSDGPSDVDMDAEVWAGGDDEDEEDEAFDPEEWKGSESEDTEVSESMEDDDEDDCDELSKHRPQRKRRRVATRLNGRR